VVRFAASYLAAALLLTACSGAPPPRATGPAVLCCAPEPARAVPPATPPQGRVLEIGGGRPEGITTDPVSGLVVVAVRGPNRLLLVDPAAGRVVHTVRVPGSARHLELVTGGGAVLVPGEDTDLLTTVALPSGRIGTSVRVRRQPHDVAVAVNGTSYTADEFGSAISVVRGGRVVTTLPGLVQPGGAAGTGDTGTVVDVRARLLHVLRGDREIAALPAGAGPTHALALTTGTVLVTDTSGGALLLYDVSGAPHQIGSEPLPGRPYGTAYDAVRSRVFITATQDNLLVEYRWDGTRLQRVAAFPTVRDAYSVTVVPATGRVVVAGESGSQLQILDP